MSAAAVAAAMWAEDHASRGLGMSLDHVAEGRAVLSMAVTEAMVNGHGICHGGFIFALADSAFAFACNWTDERTVAAHCAITYVRPARLGMRLIAEAVETVRFGRSGVTDVTVRDQTGAVIALFRGHSRTIGGRITKAQDDTMTAKGGDA
ncbi:hydroxyphenylacetyl-CoA thioesterase PaaI [Elioraea sp. Yellowstone]|jgi:acyl-CoA thioesterase|uniref:hydroxyphenylacetyl-CoA thioesterase PaaI n=1 Tax=Elioraea sp. Yellowstone TaxID=2592070 RepID=UPI00192A26BD|nr:hydroxyphenylacetyl-CoA thioesterase PaaI [Elioraea sp. Yellowstone]